MKKILKNKFNILLLFVGLIITSSSLFGCSNNNTLLFLNWGEYVNDDCVRAFEEEYNVTVNVSIADSNELFYSKIKSGTTAYDLVCPSDYMVERMVANNLLQTIDASKLTNYDKSNFLPGVIGIIDEMNKTSDTIDYYDYVMPYLWGTFGLMYNKNSTNCPNIEEIVKEYGWRAYFEKEILPENVEVGMYNVPLFAYAAGSFYENTYGPTVESDEAFESVKSVLQMRKFKDWGTDQLKKDVAAGNLDLAFVYTGDCLDMLYQQFDSGVELKDIPFDIYIPNNTIAFMDSLVIPKNARHVDLAYKFIDFFYRTEIAKANASVVGYCTSLYTSYNAIVNSPLEEDKNWAYAVSTYYPLPKEGEIQYKGTPLTNFSKPYLTKITNLMTDLKTNKK